MVHINKENERETSVLNCIELFDCNEEP